MPVHEKLSVDYNIIIACAWCWEDERLLFKKHPEVFMFDVTFMSDYKSRLVMVE